jgi:two-component system response regulator FixJ
LLVEGHLNKVIAGRLGISTRTAEHHRAHVMTKLKARSLSQLVRMSLGKTTNSISPF